MKERGVSVTLDYVLLLMIATVVLAGATAVSGTLIDDQVQRGMEDELHATGEKLAADLQDTERLINGTDTTETHLELKVDLPRQVSGEGYTISIDAGTNRLILSGTSRDIEVVIPMASDRVQSSVDPIRGGPIVITWSDDAIEVSGR